MGSATAGDFAALDSATKTFFERHWVPDAIGEDPPAWKRWEQFLFASVPYHDRAGCYALFAGLELIYVGLGGSVGGGRYVGFGLSRRLMAHVICADAERGREWSKLQPAWSSITDIYAIGFSSETAYLAASLETYLIRSLKPPKNARV